MGFCRRCKLNIYWYQTNINTRSFIYLCIKYQYFHIFQGLKLYFSLSIHSILLFPSLSHQLFLLASTNFEIFLFFFYQVDNSSTFFEVAFVHSFFPYYHTSYAVKYFNATDPAENTGKTKYMETGMWWRSIMSLELVNFVKNWKLLITRLSIKKSQFQSWGMVENT